MYCTNSDPFIIRVENHTKGAGVGCVGNGVSGVAITGSDGIAPGVGGSGVGNNNTVGWAKASMKLNGVGFSKGEIDLATTPFPKLATTNNATTININTIGLRFTLNSCQTE
jgi:hypothetical protein